MMAPRARTSRVLKVIAEIVGWGIIGALAAFVPMLLMTCGR
jgi:hypothetical protein